jgi:hypothetical protein
VNALLFLVFAYGAMATAFLGRLWLVERRKRRDLEQCFDESDSERLQLRAFVDRVVAYRHTSPDGAVHVLDPRDVEAVVVDFPTTRPD